MAGPYQASIGGMKLRLIELEAEDSQAWKIRAEKLSENWEDSDRILYHQGLPYVSEIIRTEIISRHHDDLLASYFGIEKTRELVARKYYWQTLYHNLKVYVRRYDVCLASKTVRHKPYKNLQQLPVPINRWKDLSIDFITGLPQSADWRGNGYDSILVIIDWLTKIVHYEPMQTTITAPALAKVIFNVVVQYYGLPDSIVSNRGSVFMSKF